MIAIAPYRPDDMAELIPQPEQAGVEVPRETCVALLHAGPAYTVRDADGRVLMVAGFVVNAPHHATAWCRMATGKGPAFVAATRAVRRTVDAALGEWARIDMLVRTGWKPGERWARTLGFEREGTKRGAGPQGQDFDEWSRVRPGWRANG